MLFDTVSQRFYINDELRIYLRLPVLCKERIFIKTFGKVEPTIKPAIIRLKALSPSKSVMLRPSVHCSLVRAL